MYLKYFHFHPSSTPAILSYFLFVVPLLRIISLYASSSLSPYFRFLCSISVQSVGFGCSLSTQPLLSGFSLIPLLYVRYSFRNSRLALRHVVQSPKILSIFSESVRLTHYTIYAPFHRSDKAPFRFVIIESCSFVLAVSSLFSLTDPIFSGSLYFICGTVQGCLHHRQEYFYIS